MPLHVDTELGNFAPEAGNASDSVAQIVEFANFSGDGDIVASLNDAPDGPHGMTRGAPRLDKTLQLLHFALSGRAVLNGNVVGRAQGSLGAGQEQVRRGRAGRQRRDVCVVEVAALLERRVALFLEKPGFILRKIAGGPFVEVIGDLKRRWVRRSVLEVDDDDLMGKSQNIAQASLERRLTW